MWLTLCGCFHDLSAGADDADGSPSDGIATEDGADGAGGDGSDGADAGTSHGYRWIANGPSGEREEGPLQFALTCEDPAGRPARCNFRCTYDGRDEEACSDTYDVAWADATRLATPRTHELCVRVVPLDAPDAPSDVVCRTVVSTPYARAFAWVEEAIAPDASELNVAVRCHQPLPGGGFSEPRSDCVARCSVDGAPYQLCGEVSLSEDGRFHAPNLAPGAHTLRVEITGPHGTPEEHVVRATAHPFALDADALPPYTSVVPVLPALLDDAALEAAGVLSMLAPYANYAEECDRAGSLGPSYHAERLRAYYTYALVSGALTVASSEAVEACRIALEARPVTCARVPGHTSRDLADGPLRVRLPEGCHGVFEGWLFGDGSCLVSDECAYDVCERSVPFDEERPSYGRCTEDIAPSGEGIACLTGGCDDGLYCERGLCARLKEPGAACTKTDEAIDCPVGTTCAGSPDRCIPASAQLGDACHIDRDCLAGTCVSGRCRA